MGGGVSPSSLMVRRADGAQPAAGFVLGQWGGTGGGHEVIGAILLEYSPYLLHGQGPVRSEVFRPSESSGAQVSSRPSRICTRGTQTTTKQPTVRCGGQTGGKRSGAQHNQSTTKEMTQLLPALPESHLFGCVLDLALSVRQPAAVFCSRPATMQHVLPI